MQKQKFEIIGPIHGVEIIAVRHSIRELKFLERTMGRGAGAS
ncbi:MAG TPA: hypothetical protein VMM84_11810 [Pyrinomonadaceae bacterium]|nr:hypothetical protein [Pyrinomonadaceae bacterium]